ncbi:hypothetical protein WME91_51405 [Sorangium sp. So ce269]
MANIERLPQRYVAQRVVQRADDRRWATRDARVPRRITANVPTHASHAGARRARASACVRLRVVWQRLARGARCERAASNASSASGPMKKTRGDSEVQAKRRDGRERK